MKRVLVWLWDSGIVSTFLTGLFVILPLAITIGIMAWLGGKVEELLGPEAPVGEALRSMGLRFVGDKTVASAIGWLLALVGIWHLGLLVKATAKYKVGGAVQGVINRLPIIRSIYAPLSQVASLLQQQRPGDLKGLSVVYCSFEQEHGGGFLGLLASNDTYRFAGEDCRVVYIPSAPMPMGGSVVFVPTKAVLRVDMKVDELMQINFSVGVMAAKVVSDRYHTAPKAT